MMIAFELLQVALQNRDYLSRNPSSDEWQECYDFAVQQSIEGVMFAGLERLVEDGRFIRDSMPKILMLQWIGETELIKSETYRAIANVRRLSENFCEAGFRTCLLKGVGNSLFYVGMTRSIGDIDLWVVPSGERHLEKAKRLTQDYVHRLYPEARGEFLHMDWPWDDEHRVEIHFTPSMDANPWVDRLLQRFFENQAEACFDNKTWMGFAIPTKVVNGVFLMHHAKRHFINQGIGLRHVIDYALLLRTLSEEEKRDVWQLMGQFDLQRFATGVMYVITEVLGEKMSAEMKTVGWETDKKRGEYLLKEIIKGGNFGHHYKREVRKESAISRWLWFMAVALKRMRFFPSEAFWSFVFRLRLGWSNIKERKLHNHEN